LNNSTEQQDGSLDVDLARRTLLVKARLDGLILSVELTLISILLGADLSVLVFASKDPVLTLQWEYWPYILVGLLGILIFWARALVHSLSFIGWPLDFSHNFLYVVATFVQALTLSQVVNVFNWYLLSTVTFVMTWLLYYVDLRLLRSADDQFKTDSDRRLYADIQEEQLQNVRFLIPAAIAFHVLACWCISTWPERFVQGHGHLGFATAQIFSALFYLYQTSRHLQRRQDRIFERILSSTS